MLKWLLITSVLPPGLRWEGRRFDQTIVTLNQTDQLGLTWSVTLIHPDDTRSSDTYDMDIGNAQVKAKLALIALGWTV